MGEKRIATSPLTGRIHIGRVNKRGNAFVGEKQDVTSDVLCAVIERRSTTAEVLKLKEAVRSGPSP